MSPRIRTSMFAPAQGARFEVLSRNIEICVNSLIEILSSI